MWISSFPRRSRVGFVAAATQPTDAGRSCKPQLIVCGSIGWELARAGAVLADFHNTFAFALCCCVYLPMFCPSFGLSLLLRSRRCLQHTHCQGTKSIAERWDEHRSLHVYHFSQTASRCNRRHYKHAHCCNARFVWPIPAISNTNFWLQPQVCVCVHALLCVYAFACVCVCVCVCVHACFQFPAVPLYVIAVLWTGFKSWLI